MSTLLRGGKVLVNDKLVSKDIRIEDGKIVEMGEKLNVYNSEIIELDGKFVSQGFVDVHVHLREPGGEHKETIESGTRAAARGGFTTVCPMPNTRPVPDSVEHIEALNQSIKQHAKVRVLPYASITERQLGKDLVDFKALKEHGAFAFTDDGVGVQTASIMYEAMQQAAQLNMAIVAHCEDNSLIYGGAMHEGKVSKALNIPGIPSICESVQIARDVLLAEAADCHYHVCHVSSKESVRVIRDAKRAGTKVTAEVTPHHLLLNETAITEDDAILKMNPPLRSEEDHQALIEALLDGTIDFIATDHAPHAADEKNQPMTKAPFGIVGSETAFPLLYTRFVKNGDWTLGQLIDYLALKPGQVFGLPYGKSLEVGSIADIAVIDLDEKYEIKSEDFLSKSSNTPFIGEHVYGNVKLTLVEGQIAYQEGQHA